ncbi:MAG: ubiquinone/menaquinone biosynthesis C-methylase UbiE [Halieaceae bacterium]|jgi:ubiquinone/menaquinone biosynthesis C-methylase UbiE
MSELPAYLQNELLAKHIGDSLSGQDPIFPSRENIKKIGPINTLREFKELGIQSLKVLLNYTHIQPDSQVLDIGCGFGRLAIPLTCYLNAQGSYRGIDVMPDAIDDCRRRFGGSHSNFEFQHIDVHNGLYNPGANMHASDSRFGFADNQFDVVFMFSVFSHMKPEDVSAYLGQIQRVLKRGGMLMATFFILNEHARDAIERGSTRRSFRFPAAGYFADDKNQPESAIAYEQSRVEQLIQDNGLRHLHTFYGQWANRRWALSGQDAVICVKP